MIPSTILPLGGLRIPCSGKVLPLLAKFSAVLALGSGPRNGLLIRWCES